jgi:RES domain-containing protein
MLIWRICRNRDVSTAFSGIGAEKYGGRWNRKGERVVYTSSTLSLASLEIFVHLEPAYMPNDLCSVVATVPDKASFEVLVLDDLPANWRKYPPPIALQEIGSKWLREQRSLLLIVPSAVNPEEKNILVNPLHPEATSIVDVAAKPFHFDPRMWK